MLPGACAAPARLGGGGPRRALRSSATRRPGASTACPTRAAAAAAAVFSDGGGLSTTRAGEKTVSVPWLRRRRLHVYCSVSGTPPAALSASGSLRARRSRSLELMEGRTLLPR
ncbi:unnamed protein product [Prorocentrum cordatum]|uniref:Uncharacterized protein n=1 Tax=Prorocentrum cordatum TaxID=2364126 RepID=A0ABN9PC93_9DINO|nr:unnamed protein product [Polarella glacialis]